MKAVGVLNTGEPVKGIIVNPHGVEVPEHVPILDFYNIANGGLGHVERTWTNGGRFLDGRAGVHWRPWRSRI